MFTNFYIVQYNTYAIYIYIYTLILSMSNLGSPAHITIHRGGGGKSP